MTRIPEPMAIVGRFLGPDGRLKQIPVKRAKLEAVLTHLAAQFEPNRLYQEKEVNDLLGRFHDDFCTLRRNLVDSRRMSRNRQGEYWLTAPEPID